MHDLKKWKNIIINLYGKSNRSLCFSISSNSLSPFSGIIYLTTLLLAAIHFEVLSLAMALKKICTYPLVYFLHFSTYSVRFLIFFLSFSSQLKHYCHCSKNFSNKTSFNLIDKGLYLSTTIFNVHFNFFTRLFSFNFEISFLRIYFSQLIEESSCLICWLWNFFIYFKALFIIFFQIKDSLAFK